VRFEHRKVGVERILVLTDSSVCLSRDEALRSEVRIVPITILLDGTTTPDDSIDPEVVFAALNRDDTVKSSPPSVIDYLTAIEDDPGSGVLVLTPAAEFTSMFLHASHAAELAAKPVRVVDTRTAAAAQRLVLLEVVAARDLGADLDEMEAIARRAVERVELIASLDRTATIERSGRVPSPVFATAEQQGGVATFRFRDGSVVPLQPSEPDPLVILEREWNRGGGRDARATCVFHAGAEERAAALRARLDATAPIIPFSPAMAIHTGPGVVGVAWVRS
jgi:DegV family protein with EDD domain